MILIRTFDERENETPTNENCCLSVKLSNSDETRNQKRPLTRNIFYNRIIHVYISLIIFAIKDALLVQCESDLQMLGANKMPPF